jgi:hypothetical protein
MPSTAACTSYADDVEAVVPHGQVVELVEIDPVRQDQRERIRNAGVIRARRRIRIRIDRNDRLRPRDRRTNASIAYESCSHGSSFLR